MRKSEKSKAGYTKRPFALEDYHPVVPFTYFIGMVIAAMITLNPAMLFLSFTGAILTTGVLIGGRRLFKSLTCSLPIFAVIAIVNPLFVHNGETVLFFLNGNPVTQEAIYYGCSASLMIITVFYWFKCFSILMTEDKIVCLLGKATPGLALLLSMSLGLIPKLNAQYKRISSVQKSLGMYSSNSITDRILSRFRVLSALIGWALESSVETADSMNARGYGLKGRSSFALFEKTKRDGLALFALALGFTALFTGMILSERVEYYPVFKGVPFGIFDIMSYAVIAATSMFTLIVELQESIRWRISTYRV